MTSYRGSEYILQRSDVENDTSLRSGCAYIMNTKHRKDRRRFHTHRISWLCWFAQWQEPKCSRNENGQIKVISLVSADDTYHGGACGSTLYASCMSVSPHIYCWAAFAVLSSVWVSPHICHCGLARRSVWQMNLTLSAGTHSEEVQISALPRVGNHAWHLDERRALAAWLTGALTRGDGCKTPAAQRHKDHRRAGPCSTRSTNQCTFRRHRAKQCDRLISEANLVQVSRLSLSLSVVRTRNTPSWRRIFLS